MLRIIMKSCILLQKFTSLLCLPQGCADFVPSCLDFGSQFAGAAEFESFGEVVQKANTWVRQQQHVRITNVQSIDYKLPHGTGWWSFLMCISNVLSPIALRIYGTVTYH